MLWLWLWLSISCFIPAIKAEKGVISNPKISRVVRVCPAHVAIATFSRTSQMVGAIHGRLLTAWATAGILGQVIVNYMRDYRLGLGIPLEQVYNQTMYILVGMLVIGLPVRQSPELCAKQYYRRNFQSEKVKCWTASRTVAVERPISTAKLFARSYRWRDAITRSMALPGFSCSAVVFISNGSKAPQKRYSM